MKRKLNEWQSTDFTWLNGSAVEEKLTDIICGSCEKAQRDRGSDIGECLCRCAFDWTDPHCLQCATVDYYLTLLHDRDEQIKCLLGDR